MEKENNLLVHEESIQFALDDFDEKGRIKASGLMYVFQEAAAAHAELLGVGFEPLMAQNYIWVLTKLRFKVEAVLEPGKTYRLRTYPRPKKGVTFFREFFIYDDGGKASARGTSQWCIINFETRRIERTKIGLFDGTYIEEEAFEGGIEKFKIQEDALMQMGEHKVTEEDLDENRHVNNCRYADMVEKTLEGHTDFTILFSKEARLGDTIRLYQEKLDDENIAVAGMLDDGTLIFQAKVR